MGELAKKVHTRATQPARAGKSLIELVQESRGRIEEMLPRGCDQDRFVRIVLSELTRTESDGSPNKLAQCSSYSFFGALSVATQLGLEIGAAQGQAYLIPFRDKTGTTHATFVLGYKGMIELAQRAGCNIVARAVCENDVFEMDYGSDSFVHKPARTSPGKAVGYYAVATWEGQKLFQYVTIDEIERHRARSQSGYKEKSPWMTDYDAMARKTAVRIIWPWIPKSPEVTEAIEIGEDRVVGAIDVANVLDVVPVPVLADDPPPNAIEAPSTPVETPTIPNEAVPEVVERNATPDQIRAIDRLLGEGLGILKAHYRDYVVEAMEYEGENITALEDLTHEQAAETIQILQEHINSLAELGARQ